MTLSIDTVKVLRLPDSGWAKALSHRWRFFEGTQHDHQQFGWNGQSRDPGQSYMAERMGREGFLAMPSSTGGMALPSVAARKPDSAIPCSVQIVRAFSDMLFGEGRTPHLSFRGHPNTESAIAEAFRAGSIWDVFAEARDVAGAVGAAAVVLDLTQGEVLAEVLYPFNLFVLSWSRTSWQPLDVIEQKLVERVEWDDEAKKISTVRYWTTRRWTTTHVVYYADVKENHEGDIGLDPNRPPVEHRLGGCPVVWYQNVRSSGSPIGRCDYAGVEHLIDLVDRNFSQVTKASRSNTDPTVVVKDEVVGRRPLVIAKGSGNAINVGANGDVKYLEVQGASIAAGRDVVQDILDQIERTCGVVLIDPKSAGKLFKSGEALQMIWRPMEARTNRLRVPVSRAVRLIVARLLAGLKAWGIQSEDPEPVPGGKIFLAPVEKEVDFEDDTIEGQQKQSELVPQVLGDGKVVELIWPPYWRATASQVQATGTALATATGGKSILSRETAVEVFASILGVDVVREVRRIDEDVSQQHEEDEAAANREIDMLDRKLKLGKAAGGEDDEDEEKAGGKDDDDDDEGEGG